MLFPASAQAFKMEAPIFGLLSRCLILLYQCGCVSQRKITSAVWLLDFCFSFSAVSIVCPHCILFADLARVRVAMSLVSKELFVEVFPASSIVEVSIEDGVMIKWVLCNIEHIFESGWRPAPNARRCKFLKIDFLNVWHSHFMIPIRSTTTPRCKSTSMSHSECFSIWTMAVPSLAYLQQLTFVATVRLKWPRSFLVYLLFFTLPFYNETPLKRGEGIDPFMRETKNGYSSLYPC